MSTSTRSASAACLYAIHANASTCWKCPQQTDIEDLPPVKSVHTTYLKFTCIFHHIEIYLFFSPIEIYLCIFHQKYIIEINQKK